MQLSNNNWLKHRGGEDNDLVTQNTENEKGAFQLLSLFSFIQDQNQPDS